jgi:hypothetical protein
VNDEKLLRCATRFVVSLHGCTIVIERYDNHGGLIPDGGWVVCRWLGSMNPWYLAGDGEWRYKGGSNWPSAREALTALEAHGIPDAWRKPKTEAVA